jgi:2-aminoadipate transaminase
MNDVFRFSKIAAAMKPSPIRELFRVIAQPGMISFAGGLPDPAAFPVDRFAQGAGVLVDQGREVLQYGSSEGYPRLRDELLPLMKNRLGREVDPDELVITSGSQQAVNLIGRVLLDPGDPVVIEAPAYPGTIHSLRNAGARFVPIECDGDGMVVEGLPAAVSRCEAETGMRPKLIYTVPDFSNPTGACLSLERRHRLVELARELRIPVFEDDPYGCLRYSGEALPSLKKISGGATGIIYASSFSKILAPGVRVAWTVADSGLIRAMVLMRQGEDLCTSTVTQALVAEYSRRGFLDEHLETILAIYSKKCRTMQQGLTSHLEPGAAVWHEPHGGFFFWLRFPGRSSRELFDRAIEERVAFIPGEAFYPTASEQIGEPIIGEEFARLCFTFADEEQINEGCQRLSRALVAE